MRVFLCGSQSFNEESTICLRGSALRSIGAQPDPWSAAELIEELAPDIAIVDMDSAGLEGASQIARKCPRVMVYVAADRPGIDLYRRAMSYGMRGVVRKPLEPNEIIRAVETAREEEMRRMPRVQNESWQDVVQHAPMGPVAKQEIIVVYSPKGGVGKTTIAANIAASYLSGAIPRRSVLVDLDVNANVATMLQMPTPTTVADWGDFQGETLDRHTVDSLLVKHPSGLMVVPGIRKQIDAGVLTAAILGNMIKTLRRYFDAIIIDLGPVLNDASVVAFDEATKVYIVGTLDVPTLRLINDTADILENLGVDNSKMWLVLNRVPKKPDISVREVAELLAYPLTAKLPEEHALQSHANRGEIMTVVQPETAFSQEIMKLAGTAGEAGRKRRKGPGVFSRLFRRFRRAPKAAL